MPHEVERKFLVRSDAWRIGAVPVLYRQGYLHNEPGHIVRVRVVEQAAFLTVKGMNNGITRLEFEYPIPLADANHMLDAFCQGEILEKHRHVVVHGGHTWEIDEFLGRNRGLIIAELELQEEHTPFIRPEWLGEEVSHDPRYYNNNLLTHPYSQGR